jgi:integrase
VGLPPRYQSCRCARWYSTARWPSLEDGIITTNPCLRLGSSLKLDAAPEADGDGQVKAFTEDELARFFDAAKGCRVPYGPLFWTLALTGLRVGEAVALKWSDMDLAHGTLHVRRSRSGGGIVSTPKSGRDRFVLLADRASSLLHRLQMMRADRAERQRWKTLPDEVFVTGLGAPMSRWAIREAFIDVLRRAGLPTHHTPHSLRHTYATLLLRNGESVKFVQEQRGHASISLTVDLYGKWASRNRSVGGANYLNALTRTDSTSGSSERLNSRNPPKLWRFVEGP